MSYLVSFQYDCLSLSFHATDALEPSSLRSLSRGEGRVLMLEPEKNVLMSAFSFTICVTWEGLHLKATVSSLKNEIINLFLDTSWT